MFSFNVYADCIITQTAFNNLIIKHSDGSRDFIKKIPNGYRGVLKGKELNLYKIFDTIKGNYGDKKIRFNVYDRQTKGNVNITINDFGDVYGTILDNKVKCYKNAFGDIICKDK